MQVVRNVVSKPITDSFCFHITEGTDNVSNSVLTVHIIHSRNSSCWRSCCVGIEGLVSVAWQRAKLHALILVVFAVDNLLDHHLDDTIG